MKILLLLMVSAFGLVGCKKGAPEKKKDCGCEFQKMVIIQEENAGQNLVGGSEEDLKVR